MSDRPAAERVQQAMQLHGSGRLDEAQALYEQLLADEPEHPDALHLFGVLQAQRGRHAQAHALITRAVALNPREAMFHNNLGNVAIELGRADEAESHYMHAIELDPGRLDALNNLGVLLSRSGRHEGAERVLQRVVELSPGFRDAQQNLASHYLRLGRLQEAVDTCIQDLVVAPRSNHLRRLLGAAYGLLGMKDEAIAVYRGWLEAEPGHPVARHHLQALLGEAVERAPDDYVKLVFDTFASSFDAKLADLQYRAPQLVADTLARRAGPPARALVVVDAGCGTGLCGPLLAPHAATLAGVDLSRGMLEVAQTRGSYDTLHVAELVAFLGRAPAAWDAIVSADTLCYFGRLDGFAAAAQAALRPGGWLVFTVESLDAAAGDDAFRLQHHGRYSHRRAAVEATLATAGLEAIEAEPQVLRQEAGAPVDGWVFSARRGVTG